MTQSTPVVKKSWLANNWLVVLALLAVLGTTWHAWQTSNNIKQLQAELIKRQDVSQTQAQEALLFSKQSQELSREASARVALLDVKLNEVALQRTQLDSLIQSFNRSQNDNLLSDLETSLRIATQQASLIGSAEPLVAVLDSANERLARISHPRFDQLRIALTKDLADIKNTHIVDLPTLAIRFDEAIRKIDGLPLLGQAHQPEPMRSVKNQVSQPSSGLVKPKANATWSEKFFDWGRFAGQSAWQEAKTLIRVTKISQPEAALIAPDQSYFLKENLKLRLLNARLSLLSRQNRTALSDLQSAKQLIERYFDPSSAQSIAIIRLLNELAMQTQQLQIPKPDNTFAAMSSLNIGP